MKKTSVLFNFHISKEDVIVPGCIYVILFQKKQILTLYVIQFEEILRHHGLGVQENIGIDFRITQLMDQKAFASFTHYFW